MVLTVFGAFGEGGTNVIIRFLWAWYQNLEETYVDTHFGSKLVIMGSLEKMQHGLEVEIHRNPVGRNGIPNVKRDYISSLLPQTACLEKICGLRYLGPKLAKSAIFSIFFSFSNITFKIFIFANKNNTISVLFQFVLKILTFFL